MNDHDKLINTAFKTSDELDNMKAEIEILSEDRDKALKALKDAHGTGPFLHPKTKEKYQIVQRGQSFYFRGAK